MNNKLLLMPAKIWLNQNSNFKIGLGSVTFMVRAGGQLEGGGGEASLAL